jgi:flagellar biosynthetic protein FliR
MEFSSEVLTAWVTGLMVPFARIGAMLSVTPVVGSRMTPARVRLALALVLTWVVRPFVGAEIGVDPMSAAGVVVIMHQVLVGLAMGLALQVGFAALTVGGQIIANAMGLGFASIADPQNGVQVPVLSELYFFLGALLFFALGGHLVVVELLATSFRTLPVTHAAMAGNIMWGFAAWSGLMFSEGLRIALPVVSLVLLTNLAFGVATRAAPQLNIFAVGFSITLLLGLVAMLFSLGRVLPLFEGILGSAFRMIAGIVQQTG